MKLCYPYLFFAEDEHSLNMLLFKVQNFFCLCAVYYKDMFQYVVHFFKSFFFWIYWVIIAIAGSFSVAIDPFFCPNYSSSLYLDYFSSQP